MAATVLVAHGDTHQLERMVKELAGLGLRVIATPDGGDAFARFFEEQPDLVICSETLPVLDGRSFGRMIHSQTPSLPVVLLANQPAAGDEEFHLLAEPLSVNELFALLPELDPGRPTPASLEESLSGAVATAGGKGGMFDTLLRFQRQGNILALLDPPGIERLASIAAVQERTGEERIIREGDACDGFYLVLDGEVRVTLAERGDLEVARLGAGEFFGEMALLSEQPRSASVWAVGPTRLLYFEKEAVLRLLHDYPGLRELLGGVALQRAEENLWQALSADDEVKDSISGLLDGLDSEEGVASVEVDVQERPTLDLTGAAPPPVERTDAIERLVHPPLPRVSRLARLRRRADHRLQMWRLFLIEHQFAAGIGAGALMTGALLALGYSLWQATPRLDPVPLAPAPVAMIEEDGAPPLLAGGDPSRPPAPTGGDPPPVADAPSDPGPAPTDPSPGDALAAPAPTGDPSLRPVVDPQRAATLGRKELRRNLLAARAAGNAAEAVGWGLAMAERFELDWEAEWNLAEAAREAGDASTALARYAVFVERHVGNVYVDDALFNSAELLRAQGRIAEARTMLDALLALPKADYRERAATLRAELGE